MDDDIQTQEAATATDATTGATRRAGASRR